MDKQKKNGLAFKLSQIAAKIDYQAYLMLFGHILNPLWSSREQRRFRRSEITAKAVMRYLSLYRRNISEIVPEAVNDGAEPERVFSLWLQGEEQAPASVKACFESMRRHTDMEVVVVDENSLSDWISIPDYITSKWKSGKISNAHFSDICRIELLLRHGGIWFDATDFVTGPIPKLIMDSDFFVFMGGRKIPSWYGFIQNCFIRAKKGNPLLCIWRDAILDYWRHEDRIITYLGHQIIFQKVVEENPMARKLFAAMPRLEQDPTHELWYGHKDDPYDEESYIRFTKETFFQKTDFKQSSALHPLPGTMADHIFASGNLE